MLCLGATLPCPCPWEPPRFAEHLSVPAEHEHRPGTTLLQEHCDSGVKCAARAAFFLPCVFTVSSTHVVCGLTLPNVVLRTGLTLWLVVAGRGHSPPHPLNASGSTPRAPLSCKHDRPQPPPPPSAGA